MKRGQAVQFNLIFVIIVGVMVLAFFLFFISRYIDLQQTKEAAEIGRDMDNIILGLKSTTQHKNLSVIFDFDLYVDCDGININNKFDKDIDSVFFGSDTSSSDIVFWSKEFRKPFRVDNVIFIIDNSKKYYSPEGFFPDFVNQGNSGNYDVGVFFGNSCPANSPIAGKKIICARDDIIEIDGVSYPFIDELLVYGAAFSDVSEFECSTDKLVDKLVNLFDIYIKKNEMLSGCSGVRNDLGAELKNIKQEILSGNYNVYLQNLENLNLELDNYECEVVY